MNDSPITVVFLDADNTLWDTDGVYEQAQLALLTHVEDRLKTRLHDPDRLGVKGAVMGDHWGGGKGSQ